MAKPGSPSNARLNLTGASILLVESNPAEMDIFIQILSGLGAGPLKCAESGEAGIIAAEAAEYDLVIVDSVLADMDGYQFVRALRRCEHEVNRLNPVILITGHTQQHKITAARDCGANFVIAKPVTPQVFFERIFWVSKDKRQFVEASAYVGPDRRFRMMGPPVGTDGRRENDLSAHVGDATTPNLSQGDIDALFNPVKLA